jgi:hypothetical protein
VVVEAVAEPMKRRRLHPGQQDAHAAARARSIIADRLFSMVAIGMPRSPSLAPSSRARIAASAVNARCRCGGTRPRSCRR